MRDEQYLSKTNSAVSHLVRMTTRISHSAPRYQVFLFISISSNFRQHPASLGPALTKTSAPRTISVKTCAGGDKPLRHWSRKSSAYPLFWATGTHRGAKSSSPSYPIEKVDQVENDGRLGSVHAGREKADPHESSFWKRAVSRCVSPPSLSAAWDWSTLNIKP